MIAHIRSGWLRQRESRTLNARVTHAHGKVTLQLEGFQNKLFHLAEKRAELPQWNSVSKTSKRTNKQSETSKKKSRTRERRHKRGQGVQRECSLPGKEVIQVIQSKGIREAGAPSLMCAHPKRRVGSGFCTWHARHQFLSPNPYR